MLQKFWTDRLPSSSCYPLHNLCLLTRILLMYSLWDTWRPPLTFGLQSSLQKQSFYNFAAIATTKIACILWSLLMLIIAKYCQADKNNFLSQRFPLPWQYLGYLQTRSKIWPENYCEEIHLEVRVVLKPRGTGLQVQLNNHAVTLPSAWFTVSR